MVWKCNRVRKVCTVGPLLCRVRLNCKKTCLNSAVPQGLPNANTRACTEALALATLWATELLTGEGRMDETKEGLNWGLQWALCSSWVCLLVVITSFSYLYKGETALWAQLCLSRLRCALTFERSVLTKCVPLYAIKGYQMSIWAFLSTACLALTKCAPMRTTMACPRVTWAAWATL
jgi:hypothetical protein